MTEQDSLWKIASQKAFSDTNKTLLPGSFGIVVAALLIIAYLMVAFLLGGRDLLQGEAKLKLAVVIAPLLVWPLVFVVKFIGAAGAAYRHAVTLADTFRQQLMPVLTMSITQGGGVTLLSTGHVSTSMNGRRQTVMNYPRTIVRIACTNTGAMRAEGCQGQIVDVQEVAPDGRLIKTNFVEAIELSWARDIAYLTRTEIDPGATKTMYALVRPGHPQLQFMGDPETLPIEYSYLMESNKRYRFWVTLSADGLVVSTLVFDAWPDDREVVPPPVMIHLAEISNERISSDHKRLVEH